MDRITAIYARVSTERQADEGTIESQLDALRTFVLQQGWRVDTHHEFVDNGISGTTLDRPALDRLRDAIAAGQIQRVVVISPDRLSRNFVHQEYLREEWAKAGCELVYVQGPRIVTLQDLLTSRVQGIFAEYERLVFLERMRRGLLYRARQGEPPAPAPWGYRYLPAENGLPARWEVEPDPAEWVRRIYRWVREEHLGIRAVVRRLTEFGVPPPKGGNVWHPSTVYHILTNPAYRGEVFYHRTGRDRADQGGGGKRKVRPEEEWIRIPVPAIVSAEEWEMVQEELERHRQLARRHARPRCYLLQGLIRCGLCGRRLAGKESDGHRYYICRSKRDLLRQKRCPSRWVRADALEEAVWTAVEELLLSPEQVYASYEVERQAWLEGEEERERQQLEREAERLQQRQQRLLDAYEMGVLGLEELQRRRQRIVEAQRTLDRQRRAWEQRHQCWKAYEQALSELERYRTAIQEGLERLSFEQRREILTLLVEEVVIYDDRIVIRHILPPDRSLCSIHLGADDPSALNGEGGRRVGPNLFRLTRGPLSSGSRIG